MLQGVNIEDIKKYNESLKVYKDKAAKLRAEIEFNTAELNRLCQELTAELGIQVTVENLEAIYNERVAKINSTLETGKEILRRIAEEEQTYINNQNMAGVVQQQQVFNQQTNMMNMNSNVEFPNGVFNIQL